MSADASKPAESPDGRGARTYGDPSTFGTSPWHDQRGWWKVAADGDANDIRAHFGRHHDVAVAATSLRGNRHRYSGTASQDSFALRLAGNEEYGRYIIAVVCDGMGSAPYSAFGARLVAQQFCSILEGSIEESADGWRSLVRRWESAILEHVTKSVADYRPMEYGAPDVDVADFSLDAAQTTVTFAVIPVYPVGSSPSKRDVFIGYIGDSPAFVLQNHQWIRVLEESDGSVWDSATDGALGATNLHYLEGAVSNDQAILLSSDGLGNYLQFDGETTQVGEDLGVRWSAPVEALEFVRDLAFHYQGADDDRTAVMIWFG